MGAILANACVWCNSLGKPASHFQIISRKDAAVHSWFSTSEWHLNKNPDSCFLDLKWNGQKTKQNTHTHKKTNLTAVNPAIQRWPDEKANLQLKKQKLTICHSHRYSTKLNCLHSWSQQATPETRKRRNYKMREQFGNHSRNKMRNNGRWILDKRGKPCLTNGQCDS